LNLITKDLLLCSIITSLIFTFFIGSAETSLTWQIQTVDSIENFNSGSSLAFNSNGNPCISYWDNSNKVLNFAFFDASVWQIQSVYSILIPHQPELSYGASISLAFDSIGNPCISYQYVEFGDAVLGFACFDGSTWQKQTVDSSIRNVDVFSSLAFDFNGNPSISYYDNTNLDLRFACFDGSNWQIHVVDSRGNVGLDNSLAFDFNGNPSISYHDDTTGNLKFAFFDGSPCWQVHIIDFGESTSLAFDSEGNPCVSYYDRTNGELKYASGVGYPDVEPKVTLVCFIFFVILVIIVFVLIFLVWFFCLKRLRKTSVVE